MALSSDEKARIVFHLGYPITSDMTQFMRIGYTAFIEKTHLAIALDNIDTEQESNVRRQIAVLDGLNESILNAIGRIKARVVGKIELNPSEISQLKGLYNSNIDRLANGLGVPVYSRTYPIGPMLMGGF